MNWTSIVLDGIALILLVGCALFYAKRGFLASLISFLGTLISLIGSILFANWLSPVLFNSLFRSGLENRVAELLQQTGVQTVSDVLKNIFGFLPQSVADMLGASFTDSVAATSPELASKIVNEAVMPLIVPIITVVLFLVLFLVLRVLVAWLSKLLTGANKIPLLGAGNRLLGFVAGILVGGLYVYLLLCAVWGVDAVYGGGLMAAQYFDKSLVYRFTAAWNIFAL